MSVKKLLLSLFVVVGVAVLSILVHHYYNEMQKNGSKAFIDKALPVILSSWDGETAAPYFVKEMQAEDLNSSLAFYKPLGALKEIQEVYPTEVAYGLDTGKQQGEKVAYKVTAVFENDTPKIQIIVIKQDGEWKILKFMVKSDYLMKNR